MLSAECPNCGSSVAFRHAASAATVCESCHSTVLREGVDQLVLWGQVSAFSRDLSPIQVGAEGVVGNRRFSVAGVLRRSRPGVRWNEWYVVFDDGGTGWLAEGNGFLQIFGGPLPGVHVPGAHHLSPGMELDLGDTRWVVIEVSQAAVSAADGELPFPVRGGEMRAYADLRSKDGRQTGTIDYSEDSPELWPGRVVTLESLKMTGLRAFAGWSDPHLVAYEGPEVETKRGLECPNCGGALQLRSPGTTVQLTCEYCGSDLGIDEVGDSNTAQLLRAHEGIPWAPRVPLGKRGRFDGVDWEIIGAMKRAVRVDGVDYPWVEYFLHNPYRGSRFLIEDQRGHWNLVDRMPDVPTGQGHSVWSRQRHGGEVYRHFQGGTAIVRNVLGEFDWEVAIGDQVGTHDYVAPPYMISREGDKHEVTWSKARYLEKEEVEKAFGVQVRTPWGVAANQPNPHARKSVWYASLGAAAALWVGSLFVVIMGFVVASNDTLLNADFASTGASSDVFVSRPFEVDGVMRTHLEVTTKTSLSRSAGQVHVALINKDNGKVYQPIRTTSTNSTSGMVHMAASGTYVARVEVARPSNTAASDKVNVRVVLDPPTGFPCFAFFYPFLIPLVVTLRRGSFETRRWAESDHAG